MKLYGRIGEAPLDKAFIELVIVSPILAVLGIAAERLGVMALVFAADAARRTIQSTSLYITGAVCEHQARGFRHEHSATPVGNVYRSCLILCASTRAPSRLGRDEESNCL